MKTLSLSTVALLLAVGPAAGGEAASSVNEPSRNALEVVRSSGAYQQFARLVSMAEAAGIDHALAGEGPVTVFVPGDRAFANPPHATRRALFEQPDRDFRRAFLLGHVTKGRLEAADLAGRSGVRTLSGRRHAVEHKAGRLIVGRAVVKAANIPARNGIVHSVSGVLALPERDIAGVARTLSGYATFASLFEASGLAARLRAEGPYTVFAPSDEAFARLSDEVLVRLRDERHRDELRAFLKRHVVRGRVYAEDAIRAGSLATLDGACVAFTIRDGREMLGGARLRLADRDALDGVLHGIDAVLAQP